VLEQRAADGTVDGAQRGSNFRLAAAGVASGAAVTGAAA
jgi:hypothetical protein